MADKFNKAMKKYAKAEIANAKVENASKLGRGYNYVKRNTNKATRNVAKGDSLLQQHYDNNGINANAKDYRKAGNLDREGFRTSSRLSKFSKGGKLKSSGKKFKCGGKMKKR